MIFSKGLIQWIFHCFSFIQEKFSLVIECLVHFQMYFCPPKARLGADILVLIIISHFHSITVLCFIQLLTQWEEKRGVKNISYTIFIFHFHDFIYVLSML